MSSFDESVKYLGLVPARKATLTEAQQAPIPFDKYYALVPARTIRRLYQYITIPSVSIPSAYLGLEAQYNFSVTGSFILIPDYGQLQALSPNCAICIRYRVGDVVTRRMLTWQLSEEFFAATTFAQPNWAYTYRSVQAPFYVPTDVIKDNFVIEFYTVAQFLGHGPVATDALTLKISLLEDPATASTKTGTVNAGTLVMTSALEQTFPIDLPITFPSPDHEWLDNP